MCASLQVALPWRLPLTCKARFAARLWDVPNFTYNRRLSKGSPYQVCSAKLIVFLANTAERAVKSQIKKLNQLDPPHKTGFPPPFPTHSPLPQKMCKR